MANDGKVCGHCREVNPPDARECRRCGRYFIQSTRNGDADAAEALKRPAVICAMLLLVSLFLPWLTVLFFSVSAVQLLGLFRGAAGVSLRQGGAWIGVARLFIALIPAGSLAVILFALRGSSAILIGKLTGLLPLAVFLVFFVQGTGVVSMMGAGFVIAILAGIGLFVFSRD
ncbi:MAG TPA: hypothetical protein PK919_09220 [Candidatus Aminicenantes bacterium]|nr:hypothetical protein [Candidatus Aminicenantes bacterium]